VEWVYVRLTFLSSTTAEFMNWKRTSCTALGPAGGEIQQMETRWRWMRGLLPGCWA
jgi:hypothetical protein